MKNQSRRIGGTDYIITNYICSSEVKFMEVETYGGGTVGEAARYKSIEAGITAIQQENLKGYKKYVLTINEAIARDQVNEFNFGVRAWEYIKNNQGEYKKTGFLVIVTKEDPFTCDAPSIYGMVSYCRSQRAADEIKIDTAMLLDVVDTTEYGQSEMFYLNNGMSEERWMST